MFYQPQSVATAASTEAKDVPDLRLTVSESSATLSTLLRYPATVIQIPNYDLAVEVIKRYDKYDINVASLHLFLRDALL
ncbi:hypothetical protein FRB96_002855 [Tulasnella sp. 330]|nr:hypothetical protein FRB96_002855 [Tulasnella sp. 330]KAG8869653.1 hypothetical protein FRB97_000884 [Tulasnella sp. 331]KAG8871026.1 hypothetical protein FRB98_001114 [Tulasnella sp. 332]